MDPSGKAHRPADLMGELVDGKTCPRLPQPSTSHLFPPFHMKIFRDGLGGLALFDHRRHPRGSH